MILRRGLLLVVALSGSAPLAAQTSAALDAGSLTSGYGGLDRVRALALTPSLTLEEGPLRLAGAASGEWADEGSQLTGGRAQLSLFTPTLLGLRAELRGRYDHARPWHFLARERLGGGVRLHTFRPDRGLWIGAEIDRGFGSADPRTGLEASAGGWTRLRDVTLSFSIRATAITAGSDTLGGRGDPDSLSNATPRTDGPDEGAPVAIGSTRLGARVPRTDVEGSLSWSVRPSLELSILAGARVGTRRDSRAWGSFGGSLWLSDQVALVASAGRIPNDPLRGLPSRAFGMFGVRLATRPRSSESDDIPFIARAVAREFDIHRQADALHQIRVSAPGARTVELMGSFTEWMPIPLEWAGNGVWTIALPIPPGVHHVNLRVDDGAWSVPPGMQAIDDGFNGAVGLLLLD